jgi:hypothetical protein
MNWNGLKMMVSIRLSKDLHRAVRVFAATRGITAEAAYTEALTNWLGVDAPKDEADPRVTDPRVTKLQTILESGDELAIDVVTKSMELSYERLRPRRKPTASRVLNS